MTNEIHTDGTAGWICYLCGTFVLHEEEHECNKDINSNNVTLSWPPHDVRIANALERIATALEKIAKRS